MFKIRSITESSMVDFLSLFLYIFLLLLSWNQVKKGRDNFFPYIHFTFFLTLDFVNTVQYFFQFTQNHFTYSCFFLFLIFIEFFFFPRCLQGTGWAAAAAAVSSSLSLPPFTYTLDTFRFLFVPMASLKRPSPFSSPRPSLFVMATLRQIPTIRYR